MRVDVRPRIHYRSTYTQSSFQNAVKAVQEDGIPVNRAAHQFSIPETTLRDRISGRVGASAVMGSLLLFSTADEECLVKHIVKMASFGYGLTRAQVLQLASGHAIFLKKRTSDKPLTPNWFKIYSFIKRWPELKVIKPSGLECCRAKSLNSEVVERYYSELYDVLNEYGLLNSPEKIWNIDEKGISQQHVPPKVVCSKDQKPQAIVSPRLTTTIIGCGNACGTAIPPFFVFKGSRMDDVLLKNSSPGIDGVVSKSGWSNSIIFQKYLKEHFHRHVGSRDGFALILYDGHKSHINPALIQWAKERQIVLFVLHRHTSHKTQPLDVACFGPMQKIFHNKAQKWLLENPGRVISKFEIAEIASSAYTLAVSPTNLISGFKKSGIYPYNSQAITSEMMAPSENFVENLQESESGKQKGVETVSSDVQGMAGFLCGKLPKPADKVGKKH